MMRVYLLLFLRNSLAQTTAPTISTPCGAVSGAVDTLPYTGEPVFRYSAIPYAAPPVGALRFRPPQPFSCPWSGVLNGSLFSVECIQTSGSGTEDCLQLDVYVPANRSGAALPVFVYFHGGNLIGGSAPMSALGVVASKVAGGMVSVGVNYRLNTLGFLALDELAAEPGWVGNQGIADAIAALQWVQRSIASFGGDPSRVTIAGQSSGGTLIFALFAAPSAAGLFTGAFSMSGSPNITQNAAAKRAQDAPILATLNCSAPATPAARVACLRALPAHVLGQATNTLAPSWGTPGVFGWSLPAGIPPPAAGGWDYAGIVHVDGTLLTAPFAEALAAELVPAALIISNMAAEGDGGGGIGMRNASWAAWGAALNQTFSRWPGGSDVAARVLDAYRAEALIDADLAYAAINSDFGLTCPARDVAALVAAGAPRKHPLYIMYGGWQKSAWAASGAGRWPYHGLDWQDLGWGWGATFAPQPSDWAAAALLQKLVGDFAAGRGVLPDSWAWPPVAPGEPLSTFVMAQEGGWPGGGPRAVQGWKQRQCGVLEAAGFSQTYWWCD